MNETDFMDNKAVDLDRLRKLAGVPSADNNTFGEPDMGGSDMTDLTAGDNMEPIPDDHALAPVDGGHDDLGADDILGDAGFDAPEAHGNDSYWADTLSQLEQQLSTIPVGEFKDVIDSLRRLANYAEDIRRSLVTENQKTFLDYLKEADTAITPITSVGSGTQGTTTQPSPNGQPGNTATTQVLGQNDDDAVTAINARLGGKPQDMNKARSVFNNLKGKGVIKQTSNGYTADVASDDDFNAMISDPLNQ